jgi:hypothetical protein
MSRLSWLQYRRERMSVIMWAAAPGGAA